MLCVSFVRSFVRLELNCVCACGWVVWFGRLFALFHSCCSLSFFPPFNLPDSIAVVFLLLVICPRFQTSITFSQNFFVSLAQAHTSTVYTHFFFLTHTLSLSLSQLFFDNGCLMAFFLLVFYFAHPIAICIALLDPFH